MQAILEWLKRTVETLKEENFQKDLQEKENMEQASKIMGEISAVISKMKFGRKEDLSKLIQLKEKYEMLESGVKKFFDYSLIDKLDDLIVEAQLDQDKDSNS